MRPLIDVAYRMRRRLLAVVGWRTGGVKVMVFNREGGLLLVRHIYGRSDLWMLPGGGVGRREAPVAAAVRELAEETGCVLQEPVASGVFAAHAEGRRDVVHLFRGTTADQPRVDGVELAEARFFAIGELPESVSPATMRRIEEWLGRRAVTDHW